MVAVRGLSLRWDYTERDRGLLVCFI